VCKCSVRSSSSRFVVGCKLRKVAGVPSQSTCSFRICFAENAIEGKWRVTTSCSLHSCGRNPDYGTIVPTKWVASQLAPLIRRDEGGVFNARTVKTFLMESMKLSVTERCVHLPRARVLTCPPARVPACTCPRARVPACSPARRRACLRAHLPACARACVHLPACARVCVLTCPPARELYRAIALARKIVSGEKAESFQKISPYLNVSHVLRVSPTGT
jgi:hypothetical protein